MENRLLVLLVMLGCIALGIHPEADRGTWFLENAPVLLVLPLMLYYQPKLGFTAWTLRLMVIHAFLLMVGGYYTYAKVPFGFWIQEAMGLARNPYDRIGHLFQGLVPALIFRELMIKKSGISKGTLMTVIVVSYCLAFSALYELMEWAAALALGEGAKDFLGTQGDVWDTQWDMFMALVGACLSAFLLGPWLQKGVKPFPPEDPSTEGLETGARL